MKFYDKNGRIHKNRISAFITDVVNRVREEVSKKPEIPEEVAAEPSGYIDSNDDAGNTEFENPVDYQPDFVDNNIQPVEAKYYNSISSDENTTIQAVDNNKDLFDMMKNSDDSSTISAGPLIITGGAKYSIHASNGISESVDIPKELDPTFVDKAIEDKKKK